MHRSKIWEYFTSLSLSLLIFNILGIFGTVIQRRPHEEKLLSEFVQHAVVFPRVSHGHRHVTTTQTKNGHLGAITLTVEAVNVSLTVILKLNRNLFSSSYIEKHFTEDGKPAFVNTTNHHLSHCYYHGKVKGDHHSTAAISTCRGIRGTIVSSSGTYHIEPADSVITGQHFVFNNIHQKQKNLTCGYHHEIFTGFSHRKKPGRLKRSAIKDWPYRSNSKTRIVEMYVINDKTEYEKYDKDLSQVLSRTKDLVNIVSSLYSAVNIYIALVGIEVWTDKDLIDVVENPDKTMNNFLTYRRLHIKQPNDNAQLITGKQLGSGVVGKAPIKTICSLQYSGAVNNDHNLVVGPVATTVAHELGHNFGLSHDTDQCGCPDERCIMAPSSGGLSSPSKWSECSKQEFEDAFEQGMDYCLRNLPKAISGPPVCGNGFLEEGEQCDCGLSQDCNTSCCDPFTCKLTENATCATGACCDLEICKPKRAASICRPAVNECDLPETCNGKDEFCPSDYYHADGKPCTTDYGDSYCYKGVCHTHEGQCQLLWGRTGHKSHDGCYKHFNTMGQANGHCGFDWINTEFTPCLPDDVFCGMLHCTHRNEKLMFWKEALAYMMPEGHITVTENGKQTRYDCKGAILDVGLYMPDPGMVPDGATCGEKKICVAQHCTNLSELKVKACPDCHGHGVCNNIGECHCNKGYNPPYCDTPGTGGSISGGPTTVNNDNVSLIVGLCIFFLIILPLLIIAGFYGYKHRDNLKSLLILGPTEGYRRQQQSSIYRARPVNDVVNHGDRPTAAITTKPATVSRHDSNTSAAPVHLHMHNSHHRANVKRASSFRPEDISTPQLESSTKSLTGIPTLRHSICGAVPTGGPPAHTPHQHPVPSRPAPMPPWEGHAGQDTAMKSQESGGVLPRRPPPPRQGFGAASKHLPTARAHCPLPSLPSGGRTETSSDREHPSELALDGGDSNRRYQNMNDGKAASCSPEFTDIALDSPSDGAATSPDGCLTTWQPGTAHYNAKWNATKQQANNHHKDNQVVESERSVVKSARKAFENDSAERSDPAGRHGWNQSEPARKYTVGHLPAEVRTNNGIRPQKNDCSGGRSSNNRDGKPLVRDNKPTIRDGKPPIRDAKPVLNKQPNSTKPAVSKKPSLASTKPPTKAKPSAPDLKKSASNDRNESVC